MTVITRGARSASGIAVVVIAALVAPPADAQRPFELTPFVGAFIPVSTLAEGNGVDAKHQPSLAIGLRGSLPGAGRVGLEGVLGMAAGAVEASGTGSTAEVTGRVILANVRALWSLGTPGDALRWHAITGVGLLARGSDAYAPLEGTTDVAGVVGLGMRTASDGRWTVRIDLEDHISSADFGGGSKLQNDLLLSAGLVFSLGAR
jgi:hypothetical protein